MDTCKIAPGIYQYTAVDDCSRWRVLEMRILTKMNTHSGRTLTPVILTHCPSDLLH